MTYLLTVVYTLELMNYDDNFNKTKVKVEMTSWKDKKGHAVLTISSENLVLGAFEKADEKSGKVLENQDTTIAEVKRAIIKATLEMNEIGVQCSHQSDADFESATAVLDKYQAKPNVKIPEIKNEVAKK